MGPLGEPPAGAAWHPALTDKVVLVTGASRGIGAEIARQLARAGAHVAVNYRSKAARAELIATAVREAGRRALLAPADVTDAAQVMRMLGAVTTHFGRLDGLILNASGGLEKDRPADYAMRLNCDAQVGLVEAAMPLMSRGGCIVFVTSHWAHFYGQQPVYPSYETIAASKKAGEEALRARQGQLGARGIRFAIVSGDMIEGTITPKLLERSQPGIIAARRAETGALPTVQQFAAAVVAAAADAGAPSGQVSFVGSTDWPQPEWN